MTLADGLGHCNGGGQLRAAHHSNANCIDLAASNGIQSGGNESAIDIAIQNLRAVPALERS